MAYDNKRRGREQNGETPVRFKDGQPVFREERSYGTSRGSSYEKKSYGDKPYKKGDAGNRPYGSKRREDGDKDSGRKRYEGDEKPYYKKRYGSEEGDAPRTCGKQPYSKKSQGETGVRTRYGKQPYEKKTAEPERKSVESPADAPNARADELPYLVMGRNAVREAIKSGRSIDRILVSREPDGSLREIVSLARDRNLRVDEVGREKLDELCMPFGHGGKTGNHQGIVAQVPGVEYCEISDMLDAAKAKGERPFLILLDGIEDPHNLGSIIRSAVCAGAHGVILPKRRAVSVTAAACKASAGAVEYCKVARVANLSGAIARLKDEGLWIAGADMGGTPMAEAKLEGALALVIGSEGEGISRLVRESCDFMVSIPMYGTLDSLNASVAAAVLMFEKRRQDKAAAKK